MVLDVMCKVPLYALPAPAKPIARWYTPAPQVAETPDRKKGEQLKCRVCLRKHVPGENLGRDFPRVARGGR